MPIAIAPAIVLPTIGRDLLGAVNFGGVIGALGASVVC